MATNFVKIEKSMIFFLFYLTYIPRCHQQQRVEKEKFLIDSKHGTSLARILVDADATTESLGLVHHIYTGLAKKNEHNWLILLTQQEVQSNKRLPTLAQPDFATLTSKEER